MVYFNQNCTFPRFRRGPTFSRGRGPTFSRAEGGQGIQLLIPYRNSFDVIFQGVSGPPVYPTESAHEGVNLSNEKTCLNALKMVIKL